MTTGDPMRDDPIQDDIVRSTRDRTELATRLRAWLAVRLDAVEIGEVTSPSGSGMSSETLLFDATSSGEDGARVTHHYVARMAPDPADVPVFPTYDLARQHRLLDLVARHSTMPVPPTVWLETDPAPLGAPFFVMERVEGRVPPDLPPYTMAGWLLEASETDRRRLQDTTVDAIAALHSIDPVVADAGFLELDAPGATPLARHVADQRRFYDWCRGEREHPVLEATFDWLDEHWPEEGPSVISWGDARIGNVVYDGFEPAACLDWEMAALGPRGLDLGWVVFLHAFFQDLTERSGMVGLPDFLRLDDVLERYRETSGVTVADPEWYVVYAALRHGIVMTRVHARSAHFGQATWPDDPDDTIPHREVLRSMLAGTWWDR